MADATPEPPAPPFVALTDAELAAFRAAGRVVLTDEHGIPQVTVRAETTREMEARGARELPAAARGDAGEESDVSVEQLVAGLREQGVDITAFERRGLA